MATKLTNERIEKQQAERNNNRAAQSKEAYIKLNPGNTHIWLLYPLEQWNTKENRVARDDDNAEDLIGGVDQFFQTWLAPTKDFPKGFPVQNFAEELGNGELDPATVFSKRYPNALKNPGKPPQSSNRIVVAVEENGEFVPKILPMSDSLRERVMALVKKDDKNWSPLENTACPGTHLVISKKLTDKIVEGNKVPDWSVTVVYDSVKPTFEPDFADGLNIEDGIGGKNPEEVIKILNERGWPDFKMDIV